MLSSVGSFVREPVRMTESLGRTNRTGSSLSFVRSSRSPFDSPETRLNVEESFAIQPSVGNGESHHGMHAIARFSAESVSFR